MVQILRNREAQSAGLLGEPDPRSNPSAGGRRERRYTNLGIPPSAERINSSGQLQRNLAEKR